MGRQKVTETDRNKMCPSLNHCQYQEIISDRPPDIPS